MTNSNELAERRKRRIRFRIKKRAAGKPRLSVFRSGNHIYAQIINDILGKTVASDSTMEKDMRDKLNTGGNISAADKVGKMIAERALAEGVKEVIFDRGGYRYHGRIKALADAAREAGLTF